MQAAEAVEQASLALVERERRLRLARVDLAGHWYDTGPEAVLARVPEAVRLVERLGLADRQLGEATMAPARWRRERWDRDPRTFSTTRRLRTPPSCEA